jgi:hypothetical protein
LAATAPSRQPRPTPSAADHDSGAASIAWRTAWARENLGVTYDATSTDGSWDALGSWKIGGDGDLPGISTQLSHFVFEDSASIMTWTAWRR